MRESARYREIERGKTDLTPGEVQDGGLKEVVTHEERPLERGQPNRRNRERQTDRGTDGRQTEGQMRDRQRDK